MPIFRTGLCSIGHDDRVYIADGGLIELPDADWYAPMIASGDLVKYVPEPKIENTMPASDMPVPDASAPVEPAVVLVEAPAQVEPSDAPVPAPAPVEPELESVSEMTINVPRPVRTPAVQQPWPPGGQPMEPAEPVVVHVPEPVKVPEAEPPAEPEPPEVPAEPVAPVVAPKKAERPPAQSAVRAKKGRSPNRQKR